MGSVSSQPWASTCAAASPVQRHRRNQLRRSSTCFPGIAQSLLLTGLLCVSLLGLQTWYALHGHLVGYNWTTGYVLADEIKNLTLFMKEKGFVEAGYDYINLDDCIVTGRDSSGELIPDSQAFPNGVNDLSDFVHAQGMKFGWYTDRGRYTCSCANQKNYNSTLLCRPGSLGHEKQDAATYAKWGVDYVKSDSCFAPHDGNATAEYALMRDGLNATGRKIYFNLCWGAGKTIAREGKMLGNAWRIGEDDGGGWGPVLANVDIDAGLTNYSGCDPTYGCGWNDPGLLLVGGALNTAQGRSQFSLWSMLASKLLISVDPRTLKQDSLDIYLNKEIIKVDQDPLGKQGSRFSQTIQPGGGMAEIWTRQLVNHEWAILFFNRNNSAPLDITCDVACLYSMGLKSGEFTARDLNHHADIDLNKSNHAYGDASEHESDATSMPTTTLGVEGLGKDDSVMMRLSPKTR